MSLVVDERDAGELVIKVPPGRFDFMCYERIASKVAEDAMACRNLILDFSEATAIDSAAISMLLQLHARTTGERPLRLVHCRPVVREVLKRVDCPQQLQIE